METLHESMKKTSNSEAYAAAKVGLMLYSVCFCHIAGPPNIPGNFVHIGQFRDSQFLSNADVQCQSRKLRALYVARWKNKGVEAELVNESVASQTS